MTLLPHSARKALVFTPLMQNSLNSILFSVWIPNLWISFCPNKLNSNLSQVFLLITQVSVMSANSWKCRPFCWLSDEEKSKQSKTKTQTADSTEGKTKSVRHAYVHKPYLYSKYYSDSDDELTVEQRRQSIVSGIWSATVMLASCIRLTDLSRCL